MRTGGFSYLGERLSSGEGGGGSKCALMTDAAMIVPGRGEMDLTASLIAIPGTPEVLAYELAFGRSGKFLIKPIPNDGFGYEPAFC